jgi:hypothetical protein
MWMSWHQIVDHTGTTMLYNIGEAVKEWMAERNIKPMSMHEQMMERQRQEETAAQAQASKKAEQAPVVSEQILHGTPVTAEVFAEWNARFLAERAALKAARLAQQLGAADADRDDRLTGMFLMIR